MRVLALDIGEKRVGCALSDPSRRVASPLCVLPLEEVRQAAVTFRRVLEDWEPTLLLVGLPKTLSGEEGVWAAHIKEYAEEIAERSELPLVYTDERLSSQEAKRILRAQGLSEKAMRGRIDMVAASLFLQSWLDAQTS